MVFPNIPLTRRHQHQHETMGAQSRAKARMFTLALPKSVLIAELCPRGTKHLHRQNLYLSLNCAPAAPGTFSTGLFDKKNKCMKNMFRSPRNLVCPCGLVQGAKEAYLGKSQPPMLDICHILPTWLEASLSARGAPRPLLPKELCLLVETRATTTKVAANHHIDRGTTLACVRSKVGHGGMKGTVFFGVGAHRQKEARRAHCSLSKNQSNNLCKAPKVSFVLASGGTPQVWWHSRSTCRSITHSLSSGMCA